jgi:hypothetical protein
MALTRDQIRLLSRVISETKEHEIDCDQFVTHLAEWSERVLGGQSIHDANDSVWQHLSICPECNEEFRVLTEVLKENSQ